MKFARHLPPMLLAASLVAACTPPPEPKEPEPIEVEPTPDPPPKPKPRCEGLAEKCVADAETRATIAGLGYSFRPPEGWVYAKLEEGTVTQKGDKGPVLVVGPFTPPTAKGNVALLKAREEKIKSFGELIEVSATTPVPWFKGANQELAGLKMTLWEKTNAARAGSVGTLLIVTAPMGDATMLGIGFAATPPDAAAILTALQTLEKSSGEE